MVFMQIYCLDSFNLNSSKVLLEGLHLYIYSKMVFMQIYCLDSYNLDSSKVLLEGLHLYILKHGSHTNILSR